MRKHQSFFRNCFEMHFFYDIIISRKESFMIITITGKPCSGKSTISNILAKEHGFIRIGVGDMFKAEAKRQGLTVEEFNKKCMGDYSYDKLLDQQTAKLGKEYDGKKYIFDSRLAWHFVPRSFKVFVNLNDEEMAKRLIAREGLKAYKSYEEAKKAVLYRENLENERYKKMYGIDNTDLSVFDYVIDSFGRSPQDLAEDIWKAYNKFLKKKN